LLEKTFVFIIIDFILIEVLWVLYHFYIEIKEKLNRRKNG